MEISVPRDNCFGGNSAEPQYPPNTDIPRDGNFDSQFKHIKGTYNKVEIRNRLSFCQK